MTFSMTIRTIFEVLLFAAVIFGIYNEDRLVIFEHKLLAKIRRRRLKVIKSEKSTYKTSFKTSYPTD